MNVAIIGAIGNVESRIIHEALSRGHHVTAIVRHPEEFTTENEFLIVTKGDILDPADIAVKIKGHDVVIVTYSSGPDSQHHEDEAKAAIAAARRAGVKRILTVGGPGGFFVGQDAQRRDAPGFPSDWKPGDTARRDTMYVFLQEKELDWTILSPAVSFEPGERTGKYRVDSQKPVMNEKGENRITYEDYAVALLDELENPQFIKQHFTVGY